MTWTQDQYDALCAAINLGATKVKYQGPNGEQELTYRSLAQMRTLKSEAEAELGLAGATTQQRRDVGLRYFPVCRGTNR